MAQTKTFNILRSTDQWIEEPPGLGEPTTPPSNRGKAFFLLLGRPPLPLGALRFFAFYPGRYPESNDEQSERFPGPEKRKPHPVFPGF